MPSKEAGGVFSNHYESCILDESFNRLNMHAMPVYYIRVRK